MLLNQKFGANAHQMNSNYQFRSSKLIVIHKNPINIFKTKKNKIISMLRCVMSYIAQKYNGMRNVKKNLTIQEKNIKNFN